MHQLLAGLVIHSVRVVVLHGVGAHQLEVVDELVEVGVQVVLDLLPHRAEVHRAGDDGRVAGGDVVGDWPREELLWVALLECRQHVLEAALQHAFLQPLAQHALTQLAARRAADRQHRARASRFGQQLEDEGKKNG